MTDMVVFYGVFLIQILLCSWYLPSKMVARVNRVITDYPPVQYPKLYVTPIETYQQFMGRYQRINQVILVLGLVLLLAFMFSGMSLSNKWSEMLPVVYIMLQMMPMMLLEFAERGSFKQMRQLNVRSTRQAELTPRKLFDFVSAKLVGLAVMMAIASVVIDIYVNQHIHQGNFSLDHGTVIRTMTLIVTNLLFAAIIYMNLHGKKQDPHQAREDRYKNIEVTAKSLMVMSICLSLFMIIREGTDDMGVDHLHPLMMSLYCQFIALLTLGNRLKALKLEDVNFDVYKADASKLNKE